MNLFDRVARVAAVLSICALTPVVGQTTVNVTTTVDEAGDGLLCSLREAITTFNSGADFGGCVALGAGVPHVIDLPAGNYVLTVPGTGEDLNANGDLDLLVEMTIAGAGAEATTLDGGGLEKVLEVLPSPESVVEILDVTITGGNGWFGGGANVTSGELVLRRARVVGNSASQAGGGVRVIDAQLTVYDSEIADNEAGSSGGGIAMTNSSIVVVTNTTISGNTAVADGGGLSGASIASATLTHATVTMNIADADADGWGDGGGVHTTSSVVDLALSSSIVANNFDLGTEAPDCSARIDSGDYNLIEDSQGCTFAGAPAANDVLGIDPHLSPLGFHGGATRTHALVAPSPAGERIPELTNGCGTGATSVDQVGTVRPQDGDDDGIAACDVGAFEAPFGELSPIFADGFESGETTAWSHVVP